MSESQIVSNDRAEMAAARNATDTGGYRRIAGAVVEDWPAADEIGELA